MLVVAGMLAVAALLQTNRQLALFAGLALVAAVSLFLRFLKFYRHYSVEVYMSFLTGVPEEPTPPPPG
jgi:hypothetical protein